MQFAGTIDGKIDAKGRAFFPSAWRKLLNESQEFVLRRDVFEQCLTIYPREVWERELNGLRQRLDRWNATHQRLLRQILSEVEFFSLDSAGRFLLSKRHLMLADIQKELVFLGMDDRIEVWSKERAAQGFGTPDTLTAALEDAMGNNA